jgi:hypothetical protein
MLLKGECIKSLPFLLKKNDHYFQRRIECFFYPLMTSVVDYLYKIGRHKIKVYAFIKYHFFNKEKNIFIQVYFL